MDRLVEEGRVVAKNWDKQPYGGIAQDSVVVIGVRKGNPEGIKTFDDLLSKDVDVITPEPVQLGRGPLEHHGRLRLPDQRGQVARPGARRRQDVLEKTVVQPGSARDALAAFTQGEGDVLLAYENEAIKAEDEGEDVEYVVPAVDDPDRNPDRGHQRRAGARGRRFLNFIWSDEGQEIWAENGYRPVNPKLVDPKQFPTPKDLFKIASSAAGSKVNDEFFDDETGSVAKIEKELGVSTAG